MKRLVVIAFAAAALSLGNPAAASVPGEPQDLDAFRGQLAGFMEGLEGLPGFDEARISEARRKVAELPPEQLERMRQKLAGIPNWTALPAVLTSLQEESDISGPPPADELEKFRSDLLHLLSRMEKLSPLMSEGFSEKLGRVDKMVRELPPGSLERLRGEYGRRSPGWKIRLAGSPGDPAGKPAGKAGFNKCSDLDLACQIDELLDEIAALKNRIASFVKDFFDDIEDVFTRIANLPGTIQGEFTGLFSSIQSLLTQALEEILSIVPDTPQEAFALLGVDANDAQWFNEVAGSVPVLDPPCPAIGADIPGLGEVGTIQAQLVCKRGIDWLAGMVYELAPGDVYNTPEKALAAAFAYPVNYLCLCMESQAALVIAEAYAEHRAYLAERLDEKLSTRATETSVTDLRTALRDVDGDVAKVETKLDVLEAKSDEIAATGDEQQRFLEAFRDLVLRVNIEENLTQNPSDVAALFQLPKVLGGYLDLARAILTDTLRMNQAARQSVGNAMKELEQGDAILRVGDFQKAYQAYQRAYREAVKP